MRLIRIFRLSLKVYIWCTKFDVEQVFPSFFSLIQNQFGVNIRSVRSNNAPELTLSEFFYDKEIISIILVLIGLNKALLLNENVNALLMWLELCIFNLTLQCVIKGIVFLLRFISLIGHFLHFCLIKFLFWVTMVQKAYLFTYLHIWLPLLCLYTTSCSN